MYSTYDKLACYFDKVVSMNIELLQLAYKNLLACQN